MASRVPSRSLVDARLSWSSHSGWQVEAFATNLLDKTYIASQIQNSTSATGGIVYGAPRQYGVRARIAFGDSTAKRRDVTDDSQLRRSLDLLKRGTTQRDLFALAGQQITASANR